MEHTLERIRSQINSKLRNQKENAIVLQTLDETLEAQNQPKIASAYFALLLTLLEQDEGTSRPAILYIINVVMSSLSEKILRGKLDEILKILFAVLDEESESAPVIRSTIGCLEAIIKAQEINAWSRPALKRAFQLVLTLCADQRPKVRKQAQETVTSILNAQPTPMATKMTTDFCIAQLKHVRKTSASIASNEAVPFLSFLKSVSKYWASREVPALCELLLSLTKLKNPFIISMVYQTMNNAFNNDDSSQLKLLVSSLVQCMPNVNDVEIMVSWLEAVLKGVSQLLAHNKEELFAFFPPILTLLFKELEMVNNKVREAIGTTLAEIILSIEQLPIINNTALEEMFHTIQLSITYRFRDSWPQIFKILGAFYKTFGKAQPLLLVPTIKILDSMRMEDGFLYKAELDRALGSAVASLGPRQFLSILPLNLEQAGEKTVGRAWLLPLLREHINNTDFGFFSEQLVGLADRLEVVALEYRNISREVEAKIYETLVQQVWMLFPKFASFPLDLQSGFHEAFAERLASKIYSDGELRTSILNGLALIIESNRHLIPESKLIEEEERIKLEKSTSLDAHIARANLAHMGQFATNYLIVFFNVYSAASSETRSLILNVIKPFLDITPQDRIEATFSKVTAMLGTDNDLENQAALLDLAAIMIPYISLENSITLLSLSTCCLNGATDPTLQKRAYKILLRLVEHQDDIFSKLAEYENALFSAGIDTASPAVNYRLSFLSKYIEKLPSSQLHVLPQLVSEAILGTKEVNDKARGAAFDLLVTMGNKVLQGGSINNVDATLDEYFSMVAAGLTGTTPHMISGSIAALSRLVFEFHAKVSSETINELLQTIQIFVDSQNREIVKAALGFIKVCVVVLDKSLVEPHISGLLRTILKWSNDTQSRFKFTVRYVVERFLRSFGTEKITAIFPEEHAKLLINIRKRKQKAKRGAKNSTELHESRVSKANAYEDVLYGSESDDDDDDDEQIDELPTQGRKRKANPSTYIKDDQLADSPMNFLDRSVNSRISNSKPSSKLNQKQRKLDPAFKFSKDGKLLVAEGATADDNNGANMADSAPEATEDYYREALESKESYVKTSKRIKFKNIQNQKDDFGSDGEEDYDKKHTYKTQKPKQRPGHEFKSKKADGDIKKGPMDPFAYVPMNPKIVARKGKRPAEKISIMRK